MGTAQLAAFERQEQSAASWAPGMGCMLSVILCLIGLGATAFIWSNKSQMFNLSGLCSKKRVADFGTELQGNEAKGGPVDIQQAKRTAPKGVRRDVSVMESVFGDYSRGQLVFGTHIL